jgi:hypothetical protein
MGISGRKAGLINSQTPILARYSRFKQRATSKSGYRLCVRARKTIGERVIFPPSRFTLWRITRL